MEVKDILNELKNVHDRLDNIQLEARNLKNILRRIIKEVNYLDKELTTNCDLGNGIPDFINRA